MFIIIIYWSRVCRNYQFENIIVCADINTLSSAKYLSGLIIDPNISTLNQILQLFAPNNNWFKPVCSFWSYLLARKVMIHICLVVPNRLSPSSNWLGGYHIDPQSAKWGYDLGIVVRPISNSARKKKVS